MLQNLRLMDVGLLGVTQSPRDLSAWFAAPVLGNFVGLGQTGGELAWHDHTW